MNKKIFVLAAVMILGLLAIAPKFVTALSTTTTSDSTEAVLIKATFFSHTNDDNKDHDTGVYVKSKMEDGSSLIAHADNRDNSGDDGTEYKDGSDHQFDLDLDAPGLSKDDANNFKVQVCQHTHGNDTWKFNGRVVLYFSNKTNLVRSRDGIELKNDGACVDF